jgi:DNA helicase-2/ATP-dependent DNA helicase PcrA
MSRAGSENTPECVLAGPGAGKTYGMVDQIVEALATLAPHRHLAAITYTNAASRSIREQLFRRISPRGNVFIGTTHAFLNRFILQPFAVGFEEFPDESIFGAIDPHDIATQGGRKILSPAKLNAAKAKITQRLIAKGVVPYDAMLGVAERLLKKSHVRERVARRLQFLFVDEFQDTDSRQLRIFEQLRKAKHTKLYVVGDPEQYISGFTYGTRGQSIPPFREIPFFKFLDKSTQSEQTLNRRSNGEIVEFANQFRSDLKQKAEKPHRGESRVMFLPQNDLELIVRTFRSLSESIEREDDQLSRLYLSFENKTFDSVRTKFRIIPVSNASRKSPTILGDALELLSLALGMSQRRIRDKFGLSLLEWRRFGLIVLRRVKKGELESEAFAAFVREQFGEPVSSSRLQPVCEALSQLKDHVVAGETLDESERCSSINRAKGLEADAVLVVAKTPNELNKWLVIDRDEREADKRDKSRLGYVAFTRPREMLCLACLKAIDDETRQRLAECRVTLAT